MSAEYFCGLGPIHVAKRRCPHERIEFCPLYVAAHDGSLCGLGCDDGKLEMGECRIDRGADYGAAIAQLSKRAPEMVADCALREHRAQSQAQRERNMRM